MSQQSSIVFLLDMLQRGFRLSVLDNMVETTKLTDPRAILPLDPLVIGFVRSHILHLLLILALVGVIFGGGDGSVATASTAAVGGSSRLGDHRDVSRRKLFEDVRGVAGHEFNVTSDWANATQRHALDRKPDTNLTTPPVWHSTRCMEKWGVPLLQEEPDPNGYLIYVNGR